MDKALHLREQDSITYYEEKSTANVKVSLGNKSLFIWLLCFVQLYSYVALQDKRYDGHGPKKLNKKGPPLCLLAVKNRNKKKSIKFMIRPNQNFCL